MTDQPSTTVRHAAAHTPVQDNPAHARKQLRADIGGKWGKFSEQELADLKDNDDLVSHLVSKYGLEKETATRDAAAIVQGRPF